jgi:hypothetical protein
MTTCEKARMALAEALEDDDEKRRFEAAKSLFSYRPTEVPRGQERERGEHRGRGVFYLGDIVRRAIELGVVTIKDGVAHIGGEPVTPPPSTPRPRKRPRPPSLEAHPRVEI